MHFNVIPNDNGNSRVATTIRFVNSEGVAHTLTGTYEGLTLQSAGRDQERLSTVNDAGVELARLLHQCSDHSVLIDSDSSHSMRGDEKSSSDVFPPHQHPRITIKG